MPKLFVVATPIGNLEDITFRALRILKEVCLIAAEDTRTTRHLLNFYQIKTPLESYYEQNKLLKLDYLMEKLREGDIALVSEAGMPTISDPGYELISRAIQEGVDIVPIPGPSAIITAVAVSGMPADRFLYIGFLPRKKGEREQRVQEIANEKGAIVALEAPHRLQQSLACMLAILGDRRIAICRELTKIHEETFRGSISQALAYFTQPKGEFTLVVEGKKDEKPGLTPEVRNRIRKLKNSGIHVKEASNKIAKETGIPRKDIYQAWLEEENI